MPLPNHQIAKFLYYIQNLDENKQWNEIEGHLTILAGNDEIRNIQFDTNSTDNYFVIGCFDNSDYSSFKEIGKTYPTRPTSFDINYVCN